MNQVRVKLTDPTRIFSHGNDRIIGDETMIVPMDGEVSAAINNGRLLVVEDLGEVAEPQDATPATDVDVNDPKLSLKQLKSIATDRGLDAESLTSKAAVRDLINESSPTEVIENAYAEGDGTIENNDVIIDDEDATPATDEQESE